MQAYTGFAYVYDEYMDNIPYEEWCEYLVERLKEQGVTPDMEIADLGCGTGTVTQLLDKAGYSCVGIDNAPDMLTIAAEKLYESGQEIVYSLQDMRDFECVKKGLKPGGVFIFDLKTIHFFRDVLAENTYAENRDDSAFIWDNYYDEETRNNEYDLAVFIKNEDESFIRYEENHFQHGFYMEEVLEAAETAGLEVEAVYDAFTTDAPKEDSERLYYILRRRCAARSNP